MTLKFLADENFNLAILRGLLRRNPQIDIARVQDVGLSGAEDIRVLNWAASNNRIVLTHDLRTMPDFAYECIAKSETMLGVIVMRPDIKPGTAIDDILLILECLSSQELENSVLRLPL